MENKTVGWIIIGIAILVGVIALIFNIGLKNIVGETCNHGPTCSMYDTIAVQTWISMAIVGVILVIGIVLLFIKPKEKLIIKTIKEKRKKKDYSTLDKDEKKAIDLLLKEGNAMFQADLMEKLEIGKVGMTRLLDKLESKQLIERKRRGMNNLVVLKD
jgi:putative component of membrane protein insertase Oxa1/YidC/SpoIIIJ protein YidD